ncbi:MAG: hypothetical protein MRJ68_20865 [Nitrospira sp.]|nr:hypothetical protein [Nitrospira sp.]
MDRLRQLGNCISIPIPAADDGFTGRECPQADCAGYFKIELGTGLKGEGLPCHCPYCGHSAGHDQFWTKEQIEYARSVAMRKITDALYKDLRKMEFEHKPKGAFGIGFSMKVTPGRPVPIHFYREKQLETEVICVNCTLRYSVYGVFAFCPDCGQHNSLQILGKNLEVVGKMLDLATVAEKELAERLIENALEDCVSACDGFGREICRLNAKTSTDPTKVGKVSFQNLEGAKQNMNGLFKLDLAAGLADDEWEVAVRAFQKRHLLSHKMGVVDDEYVRKSGDTHAVVGRKVNIAIDEVRALIQIIGKLGRWLSDAMEQVRS